MSRSAKLCTLVTVTVNNAVLGCVQLRGQPSLAVALKLITHLWLDGNVLNSTSCEDLGVWISSDLKLTHSKQPVKQAAL